MLSLGVLLYRRFREGKPTRIHEAADMLMLPNDVAGQLLEGLHLAGLVHITRGGGYVLARPPESITAHDLLAAAKTLCQVPPELARENPSPQAYPQSKTLNELDALEATWARAHNLPQLAGETPAPSPAPAPGAPPAAPKSPSK
jgi:DNA-binding IscR family transcriptional regulator